MRKIIKFSLIKESVEKLFIEANYILPRDVRDKIDESINIETDARAKEILRIIKQNYEIAEEGIYPICQDTGMAVVFLEIGADVEIEGGFINDAIAEGVRRAYDKGYLRKSVVADPLRRENSNTNLPPVIYTEMAKGDRLKISVMPKGFGAENQSKQKMMTPTSSADDIIEFVANGVIASGGKACPPSVVGVGIGGTFEYSAYLSKKALLLPLNVKNPDPYYAEMEREILRKINTSGIGSQGLGGAVSCLGVKILTYPTHIAGLPVAYNYCCHACRHSSIEL
ncbi:MAG TPA: fumarate hydratase [Spirochaetota bacterium]|nr:fumarate hydratase [Spirochaetota bacterium]HOS32935.1 fumarate hydratase [Spirochaetota bacterium]HOS55505.1 fumarate hydratase [Spirochaetota bacterium]HPK62788.1 fumarate hydratase [Spirochaetota bacterium]HQF78122.1 fumarate hydratase [Spirochaetota bacterium]